jgi:hypothetical protein
MELAASIGSIVRKKSVAVSIMHSLVRVKTSIALI